MELQQELLWKIVERELGTGLISCEPLNAGARRMFTGQR